MTVIVIANKIIQYCKNKIIIEKTTVLTFAKTPCFIIANIFISISKKTVIRIAKNCNISLKATVLSIQKI